MNLAGRKKWKLSYEIRRMIVLLYSHLSSLGKRLLQIQSLYLIFVSSSCMHFGLIELESSRIELGFMCDGASFNFNFV